MSKVIPLVVGIVVVGAIIGVILLMSSGPVGPTLPPPDQPEPAPALTFTLTGLNTRWTRNGVENPTLDVPLGVPQESSPQSDALPQPLQGTMREYPEACVSSFHLSQRAAQRF